MDKIIFHPEGWIIVLKGTSQWLMDQEETAFLYQQKGVSRLHLKWLILATVRDTSGVAQCGISHPGRQTHPVLCRRAEVCSCLQWRGHYATCKKLYFMVPGKTYNQSANWAGHGFISTKALPCGSESVAWLKLLVPFHCSISSCISGIAFACGSWLTERCLPCAQTLTCPVLCGLDWKVTTD